MKKLIVIAVSVIAMALLMVYVFIPIKKVETHAYQKCWTTNENIIVETEHYFVIINPDTNYINSVEK